MTRCEPGDGVSAARHLGDIFLGHVGKFTLSMSGANFAKQACLQGFTV